jgi:hypothetical protein
MTAKQARCSVLDDVMCCDVICYVMLCEFTSYDNIPVGRSRNLKREFETASKWMRCPYQCIDQCCAISGDVMSHRMLPSLEPNVKHMDYIATNEG